MWNLGGTKNHARCRGSKSEVQWIQGSANFEPIKAPILVSDQFLYDQCGKHQFVHYYCGGMGPSTVPWMAKLVIFVGNIWYQCGILVRTKTTRGATSCKTCNFWCEHRVLVWDLGGTKNQPRCRGRKSEVQWI